MCQARYYSAMLLPFLLVAAIVQAPTPVVKKKGAPPPPPPPPPPPAAATSPLPVEEEFEDNRRVWLEGSNADFDARIENGRYIVSKKVAGGTLYTWIGVDVDRDHPYTVTTRFTIDSGGDQGVGVVWSLRDRTTFNGVYVTRKGLTTWGHNVDGRWMADSAWNTTLAAGRAFLGCNQGTEGTFEVKLEPYVPPPSSSDRRTNRLILWVNRCVLAIIPNRSKGRNFGFVINGIATISVERFAVTQP
jgi:hypothetical protein